MTNRNSIYRQIEDERLYQQHRWGDNADDTKNTPNDWVAYISKHSTRWSPGGFPPYSGETIDKFRKQMIKVAALAVAAIESLERQTENNGKPFYSE
jgi:hypothetical protein